MVQPELAVPGTCRGQPALWRDTPHPEPSSDVGKIGKPFLLDSVFMSSDKYVKTLTPPCDAIGGGAFGR